MSEPKPQMPTAQSHLAHLPNLGTRVEVDARTMTPRDTEKEAAQANLSSPEWIKETIQLPPEMRGQAPGLQPTAPKHTFTLDPQEIEPVSADLAPQPIEFSYPPMSAPGYMQELPPSQIQAPQGWPVPPALQHAAQHAPAAPHHAPRYDGATTAHIPAPMPGTVQYAQMMPYPVEPVKMQAPGPQGAPSGYPQQSPNVVMPTFTQPQMSFPPQPSAAETAASMHAVRPSSAVPPPVMGSGARTVQLPGKPTQHPVVAELLRDFGLRQSDVHEFESFGYTFRIREVNTEVLNYCLGNASKASVAEFDMSNRTRLMVAAMSVISINGTPVTEIFPWNKAKIKGRAFDPWWPSYPVQVLVAEPLFRFFFEDLKVSVISAVADEYDAVYGDDVDEDTTKAPIVANDKLIRVKCSVAGCKHTLDIEPVFVGNGSEIQATYCVHHGVAMTPIGWVKDLADIPLG